jgi:hypothetical protein
MRPCIRIIGNHKRSRRCDGSNTESSTVFRGDTVWRKTGREDQQIGSIAVAAFGRPDHWAAGSGINTPYAAGKLVRTTSAEGDGQQHDRVGERPEAVSLGWEVREVPLVQQPFLVMGVQPNLTLEHLQGAGRR